MAATHKKSGGRSGPPRVRREAAPQGAGRRRGTLRVSDLAEVCRRFGAVPVVTGAAPARSPRLVAAHAGGAESGMTTVRRPMIGTSPRTREARSAEQTHLPQAGPGASTAPRTRRGLTSGASQGA